eukprot:Opistho-1_new@67658
MWSLLREKLAHVLQGELDLLGKARRVRVRARLQAAHVEVEAVLADNHVAAPVTVVSDGAKAAARGHALEILRVVQVPQVRLLLGLLARRQPPGLAESLLQEFRINARALRHDVEAKEVAIDTLAAHGIAIVRLVCLRGNLEQADPLLLRQLVLDHRVDERDGIDRYGAHRLRAAIAEQTRHRRLVRERKLLGVAAVRELEGHLHPRVGRHAALLHKALAVLVVREDAEVKVVDELLSVLVRLANCLLGLAGKLPAEAAGDGQGDRRDGRRGALVVTVLGVTGADLHAHGPLEHVAHHGRVGPRVLDVEAALAVRKHHKRKRLVEPPVAAIAMDQLAPHLGEVARRFVVERDDEDGRVNGGERVAVDARAEIAQARLGPRRAVLGGEGGKRGLGNGGAGAVGIIDDPLELALKLEGGEGGAVRTEAVKPVKRAVAENDNVLALVLRVVLNRVELVAREAGRGKHAAVLVHTHRDRVANEHGLELLAVQHLLELEHLGDEVGGARDLDGRRHKLVRVDDVVVAVNHDRRPAHEVTVLLPPVRHVVRGNPRLEHKVALELGAFVAKKVLALLGHARKFLVREERADGREVLRDGGTEGGNGEAGERLLVAVEEGVAAAEDADKARPHGDKEVLLAGLLVEPALVREEAAQEELARHGLAKDDAGARRDGEERRLLDLREAADPGNL